MALCCFYSLPCSPMEVAPLPSSLRAVVLQLGLLPSSLGRSALLALLRRALAPSLRAPPSRRPLHAMAAAPRVACSTVPSSLALALPSAMDVVGLDSLWLRHPSCSLLRPIRLGSTMARRGRVEMWRIEESLRVLPALRCRGPSLGCAQLQLRALSLVARVLASLSCARSTSSMASRPSCPPARPLGSLGLNLHRAALLPLSLLHCRQLPVSLVSRALLVLASPPWSASDTRVGSVMLVRVCPRRWQLGLYVCLPRHLDTGTPSCLYVCGRMESMEKKAKPVWFLRSSGVELELWLKKKMKSESDACHEPRRRPTLYPRRARRLR